MYAEKYHEQDAKEITNRLRYNADVTCNVQYAFVTI